MNPGAVETNSITTSEVRAILDKHFFAIWNDLPTILKQQIINDFVGDEYVPDDESTENVKNILWSVFVPMIGKETLIEFITSQRDYQG